MRKREVGSVRWWMQVLAACAFGVVYLIVNQPLLGEAKAMHTEDMAQFEGVTISPDKKAWTTNYMDQNIEQLEKGYCVLTGVDTTLPKLQAGQHYYKSYVEGNVDIYKWEVMWSKAQCIHTFPAQDYHGFLVEAGICEKYYHSGWYAYCAACEEPVAEMYIYATKDTVEGITSMPAESEYLYICPHCSGLEQGTNYRHLCKEISYNHYVVTYDANAPTDSIANGHMSVTKHMYNNEVQYEGVSAAEKGYGDTKLRKNSFTCEGYVFVGWNENADGSGQYFMDEAAVFNLSETNGGVVTLYAQWEPAESTLIVDANGGTYKGQESYVVTQAYGTNYILQPEDLIEPSGYLVNFETNGGSLLPSVRTSRIFHFWEFVGTPNGELVENVYTFGGNEGATDLLYARYLDEALLLPDSQKENELLVGWYTDEALSPESFLGKPGEEVHISQSCTLYAKWSTLTLWAEDNYEAYEGTGAVDLSWQQKGSEKLFYKLYQSRDCTTWRNIWDASALGEELTYNEKIEANLAGAYIDIKQTGYYKLEAFGEQSNTSSGGLGGNVRAEYWLQAGDRLQVVASKNETGYGADTKVDLIRNEQSTALMIAGGGKKGGMIQSTVERTTLENPAKEDVAFKSKIPEMFPSGTVAYVLFNNNTEYPTLKISGEAWAEATGSVSVGGLNRTLQTKRTNYVYDSSGSESHWGEDIVATASEGVSPHWGNVQSAGGFSRTFVANYPTNGNTNLVVSAAIYNWSQNTDGDIRFRILNAKTGAVLYDETPVSGFSGLDGYVRVTEVLTWADYDVSNVEEVTVEVYIKQVASGAHTTVSLFDTFFYGKIIGGGETFPERKNYINTDFGCRNIVDLKEEHAGMGYVTLASVDVGYQDAFVLKDVFAKDVEPPETISNAIFEKTQDGLIQVEIAMPVDRGSMYYHMAESFRLNEQKLSFISTSNITQNMLLTGIRGYHYYVDESPEGYVTQTHDFSQGTVWIIQNFEQEHYLHVAAVDKAGNLGETTSFLVTVNEEDREENVPQVYTEKPYIVDTEYVHSSKPDVYYVKADGKTEHTLCSSAYLEQMTNLDMQIERLRIYAEHSEVTRWFEVCVPSGDITKQQESFLNDTLDMTLSDSSFGNIGVGGATAFRKEHGRVLEIEQGFCVEESKESFKVYPQALLEVDGKEYVSDMDKSLQQSITIIPDAICPHITGIEELWQLKGYDWEESIDDILLWAYDRESGVEAFYITITNNDNHLERTYYGDEVDEIWVPVDASDPLFRGSLAFLVVAIDRVGNTNIIGEEGVTFTLSASIYKERAPQEDVFKKGEGAILEIATSGYVERVEVIFPDTWIETFPSMNQVYVYETPSLRSKETLRFSVPLETIAQTYEISVIAYKKGESQACKLPIKVMEGSVLDELRTRIRNNG